MIPRFRFLKQTFRQRLCFVLHILGQLVRLFAQGWSIDIARTARALFLFAILMHKVGKKSAPVELKLITPSISWLISLDSLLVWVIHNTYFSTSIGLSELQIHLNLLLWVRLLLVAVIHILVVRVILIVVVRVILRHTRLCRHLWVTLWCWTALFTGDTDLLLSLDVSCGWVELDSTLRRHLCLLRNRHWILVASSEL